MVSVSAGTAGQAQIQASRSLPCRLTRRFASSGLPGPETLATAGREQGDTGHERASSGDPLTGGGPDDLSSHVREPDRILTKGLWRGGPVNGELIQRIAERVHRWLNEVVPDNLCRLSFGGTDKRTGNLRDMISLIEGDTLGLGI